MKSTILRNLTLFVCAFTIFAFCAQSAHGSGLTADLTCILAGPTAADVSCNPALSYGTVTLSGPDAGGDLLLTVDVQGVAGKFRDLMLNFNGGGITSVSSQDGQASLLADGFSDSPYNGLFDIGGTGQQHWNSTGDIYTTLLSGNLQLDPSMFDFKDSLKTLNVYVHLQDMKIGGEDSLKVGGVWEDGGGPPQEVPEPATAALLGGGLIALAWTLRRRKAS